MWGAWGAMGGAMLGARQDSMPGCGGFNAGHNTVRGCNAGGNAGCKGVRCRLQCRLCRGQSRAHWGGGNRLQCQVQCGSQGSRCLLQCGAHCRLLRVQRQLQGVQCRGQCQSLRVQCRVQSLAGGTMPAAQGAKLVVGAAMQVAGGAMPAAMSVARGAMQVAMQVA